jgi:hypothetical protein
MREFDLSNHEEFIRDYLERRKHRAPGCTVFFPEEFPIPLFEKHRSTLAPYQADISVFRKHLPMSFISGHTCDGKYWTDGAILIKKYKGMLVSDVWIEPDDKTFRQLFSVGERVRMAVLMFNEDINYLPVVLLVARKCWRAFLPVYIDYALQRFRRYKGLKVWLSSDGAGCVITAAGKLPAYLAEFKLSDVVVAQIDSIWRQLNEICRYRPQPFPDGDVCAF